MFHSARQSYRRASQDDQTVPSDPKAIIGLTLSELQTALSTLAAAAAQGNALPPDRMTRAMSALYLLQTSLDFQQGGEIAPALFRVYEYCRVQLMAAFRKDPGAAEGLANARDFITTLQQAWAEMSRAT